MNGARVPKYADRAARLRWHSPAKCGRDGRKLEPNDDAVHQLRKRLNQVDRKCQQQQDDISRQRQDEAAPAIVPRGLFALFTSRMKRGQNINHAHESASQRARCRAQGPDAIGGDPPLRQSHRRANNNEHGYRAQETQPTGADVSHQRAAYQAGEAENQSGVLRQRLARQASDGGQGDE